MDITAVVLKYGEIIFAVFGLLAAIVKFTPTLKDDNIVLPIIKFLGKLTNYQEKK
jgi:hypothetical protein